MLNKKIVRDTFARCLVAPHRYDLNRKEIDFLVGVELNQKSGDGSGFCNSFQKFNLMRVQIVEI